MERNFKRETHENLVELSRVVNDMPSEKDFGETVEKIVEYCIFETLRFCEVSNTNEFIRSGQGKNVELEKFENKLKEVVYSIPANNGHGFQLHAKYKKLLEISLDLTSVNSQRSKLDMSERWRYLFFRSLTALSIAGVVLITGYLSLRLGIPLPTLK